VGAVQLCLDLDRLRTHPLVMMAATLEQTISCSSRGNAAMKLVDRVRSKMPLVGIGWQNG
jgi:hypothetical protein